MAEATEIETLAGAVRAGLIQDEHFAREACGGTVVGSAYNWHQAPGGDEWEAEELDDFVMLLVALRPDLARPPAASEGYWGQVAAWQDNGDEPGVRSPLAQFAHAARHDPAAILARVARDRAMVGLLLAEKHAGNCYADALPDCPCTCGRDARVAAYLTLLAQPYAEAS